MLSKDHFYWMMTRKYIVAFSYIFSDIHVLRTTSAGIVHKDITVPIRYAGKNKIFSLMERNETIKSKFATVLPRISFLITGMVPDPARKINNLIEIPYVNNGIEETFQYAPSPYNFNIDMVVWAKYLDDVFQIVEQIAVFFKPQYTVTIKEIPELNVERNITINLNSIDLGIESEFDEESDRIVMADLNFTLGGFLYPPISESGVIELINVQLKDKTNTEQIYANIQTIYDELTQDFTQEIQEGEDAVWPD